MIKYLEPLSIITLVGLCWRIAVSANGKLKNKVDTKSCDDAQGRIHHRISELDDHLSQRFDDQSKRLDDIKDFLKNGK